VFNAVGSFRDIEAVEMVVVAGRHSGGV